MVHWKFLQVYKQVHMQVSNICTFQGIREHNSNDCRVRWLSSIRRVRLSLLGFAYLLKWWSHERNNSSFVQPSLNMPTMLRGDHWLQSLSQSLPSKNKRWWDIIPPCDIHTTNYSCFYASPLMSLHQFSSDPFVELSFLFLSRL